MKVYSIQVLRKDGSGNEAVILKAAHDLQQFQFFQRSNVEEFMRFAGGLVCGRCQPLQRLSVNQSADKEYVVHAYVLDNQLAGVVITDIEYNRRVAHSLISRVLEEWQQAVAPNLWASGDGANINFPQLAQYLKDYQQPERVDAMSKMQMDLDETKIILVDALDKVLQRGEKLSDLVDKSDALSSQSKMFYKTAEKTNKCCNIL